MLGEAISLQNYILTGGLHGNGYQAWYQWFWQDRQDRAAHSSRKTGAVRDLRRQPAQG